MAVIDRVKWDGSPEVVAWKFPSEELSTWTQLIVNENRLIAYSEPEYAVGLLETEKPVFKMKLVKR